MTRRFLNTLTKTQFRVKIEGVEGFFTSCSPFSLEREVTKVANGKTRIKEPIVGMSEYGDIEISKPYEPDSDNGIISLIESAPEDRKFTISVQPVKNNGNEDVFGRTTTFTNCVIFKLEYGEVDRESADASMLMVAFAPSGHSRD